MKRGEGNMIAGGEAALPSWDGRRGRTAGRAYYKKEKETGGGGVQSYPSDKN